MNLLLQGPGLLRGGLVFENLTEEASALVPFIGDRPTYGRWHVGVLSRGCGDRPGRAGEQVHVSGGGSHETEDQPPASQKALRAMCAEMVRELESGEEGLPLGP